MLVEFRSTADLVFAVEEMDLVFAVEGTDSSKGDAVGKMDN